jgi:hypothetical protein
MELSGLEAQPAPYRSHLLCRFNAEPLSLLGGPKARICLRFKFCSNTAGLEGQKDSCFPLVPPRKLGHFRLGRRLRRHARSPNECAHDGRALAFGDVRPLFAAHVGGVRTKLSNSERSSMLQWPTRPNQTRAPTLDNRRGRWRDYSVSAGSSSSWDRDHGRAVACRASRLGAGEREVRTSFARAQGRRMADPRSAIRRGPLQKITSIGNN